MNDKTDPKRTWVKGISNSGEVTKALENPDWQDPSVTGTIRDNVHRILTESYFKSWEPFTTTKYYDSQGGTEWLSLEQIHNMIHVRMITPTLHSHY
jgi:tyrosinase